MRKFTKKHRKNINKSKLGTPSSMKGKTHTEESKQNMSFGRIGIRLTVKERAERKKNKTREWFKNNPMTKDDRLKVVANMAAVIYAAEVNRTEVGVRPALQDEYARESAKIAAMIYRQTELRLALL